MIIVRSFDHGTSATFSCLLIPSQLVLRHVCGFVVSLLQTVLLAGATPVLSNALSPCGLALPFLTEGSGTSVAWKAFFGLFPSFSVFFARAFGVFPLDSLLLLESFSSPTFCFERYSKTFKGFSGPMFCFESFSVW